MSGALIGVDVGTGSARAGVFDGSGRLLASANRPVTTWTEAGDVVEQSGEQIWEAVCESVREAVLLAGLSPRDVAGLGFDATCSLALVDEAGAPVTASPSGDPQRNVVVWMDHRATAEAEEINAKGHPVLDYVGGRISPEMETPKLLWLRRHLPESFARTAHFLDLADFLTWKATGSLARSVCTVTCKWTYLAHEGRWDPTYFESIGLGELASEQFRRIGTEVVEPGTPLGAGLSDEAAAAMGLLAGTAVGAGLIDAHAGGVGTLAATVEGGSTEVTRRLAYVFGTSACSMATTAEPAFVPGVWGPYFSAMVPGLWLNEGGQSAAGAAIDHLATLHPLASEAAARAADEGLSLTAWLDREAAARAPSPRDALALVGGVHVVPEFLGNRSPFADPEARAVIAGLGLERDEASLVGLHVAGLMGIGYGLRQLRDRLVEAGIGTDAVVASGGAARSPFVCQVLADAAGVPVAVAQTSEPVLLGSAMLAAVASGLQTDLAGAMAAMSGAARQFEPEGGDVAVLHARRYAAFTRLQDAARDARALLGGEA